MLLKISYEQFKAYFLQELEPELETLDITCIRQVSPCASDPKESGEPPPSAAPVEADFLIEPSRPTGRNRVMRLRSRRRFTRSRSRLAAGLDMPIFSRSSGWTYSKCWRRDTWRSSLRRTKNCSSWTCCSSSSSHPIPSSSILGRTNS